MLPDPIFAGRTAFDGFGGGVAVPGSASLLQQILNTPEILWFWDARYDVTSASERLSSHRDMKAGVADAQGTGAAQPIVVPYDGESYGWCPGVNSAANNFNLANDASFQITTGNIGIAVRCAPNALAAGVTQVLLAKASDSTHKAYFFDITTAAKLLFGVTADGSTNVQATSSVAITANISAFTFGWAGVFWDNSGGNCYFYTAPDQAGVPGAWTQLGTTQALATTTVFSDTSAITLGRQNLGSTQFAGKLKRVLLYTGNSADHTPNGAGTTLLANVDFTAQADQTTTWNEPITGKAVTLGTAAALQSQIIGRPYIIYDANAYYTTTGPQTLAQPCGVILCGIQRVWTLNRMTVDGVAATAGILQSGTTPNIRLNAGSNATENTEWTLGTKKVIGAFFNGASSFLVVNQGTEVNGNPGTNNPGGIVTGTRTALDTFSAIQLTVKAVLNQAVTAARLREIIALIQLYTDS